MSPRRSQKKKNSAATLNIIQKNNVVPSAVDYHRYYGQLIVMENNHCGLLLSAEKSLVLEVPCHIFA
jgi:glutathionylspermidine synthase